jgi:hypothetical protein
VDDAPKRGWIDRARIERAFLDPSLTVGIA